MVPRMQNQSVIVMVAVMVAEDVDDSGNRGTTPSASAHNLSSPLRFMPSRPLETHPRRENRHKPTRPHAPKSRQHGIAHNHRHPHAASGTTDVLLSIPSESLTHVTSFLSPPDLLALARTCHQLNTHVADDNTWLRAYVYHYLGIAPESDLHGDATDKTVMLRREESSWRKEFIQRYKLRRRWEYSRNTTITHIPHHSMISGLHLMPHTTLLAASLQYGVVSRSYPLSGKVLRGFLDASGTLNGLGIGNPNAEFSPHVSSIALASEGGTAKVSWGFRNGDVAVTMALRAMDHNRTSAAKLVRCRPQDCHEGAVECVAWATGGQGYTFLVSGGADGRVKLWEVKTAQLKCLWTSDKGPSLVPDPCVKIVVDSQQSVIASGLRSGTILVWTGFDLQSTSDVPALDIRELRIPAPASPTTITTASPGTSYPPLENTQQEIADLRITPNGDALSLLVAYRASPLFYRLSCDSSTGAFGRSFFGDQDVGAITAIYPVWASRSDERDFVIAGDQHGNISIYPWDGQSLSSPSTAAPTSSGDVSVPAVRRLDAHEDGAVTALAWNSAVLVSGSSRGTIKVWDSLTLGPLRSFPSPAARPFPGGDWDPVSQILLESDALMVSVGSRVLAWKAGPVGRSIMHGKGKVRAVKAGNYNGVAKWQQQIEMYKDISESRRELEEEKTHSHRAFGREKDQLSTLAHLGLSEVEAVEYVLMLSRDEEEARRRPQDVAESSRTAFRDDEGVFIGDFDDVPTPMATRSSMFGSEASSAPSSRASSFSAHSAHSSPNSDGIQTGRAFPRVTPSSSNHKVQVSPRHHPEPMEARFIMSPLPASRASLTAGGPPPASDLEHFPAVVNRTSSASASGSSASLAGSAPGSPRSIRSAWSTPLRSLRSSEAPSPTRLPGAGSASPVESPPVRALSGALTSAGRLGPSYAEEDDGDLRFALELSLAEARSRGEDV
ncbi:hypothetical protein GSI_11981 [Ganoderma sinense ZZ0214-1]|uniref:F-box domain-containing protein n=1 Tax=Ganoderma sinense ZZ0214-1 TaxID=1077348 RepID=A0A2G8RXH9_9APHY|nr:hypothetical protein GSI_11981 [Ganoderma sinense ZZ0214-1]